MAKSQKIKGKQSAAKNIKVPSKKALKPTKSKLNRKINKTDIIKWFTTMQDAYGICRSNKKLQKSKSMIKRQARAEKLTEKILNQLNEAASLPKTTATRVSRLVNSLKTKKPIQRRRKPKARDVFKRPVLQTPRKRQSFLAERFVTSSDLLGNLLPSESKDNQIKARKILPVGSKNSKKARLPNVPGLGININPVNILDAWLKFLSDGNETVAKNPNPESNLSASIPMEVMEVASVNENTDNERPDIFVHIRKSLEKSASTNIEPMEDLNEISSSSEEQSNNNLPEFDVDLYNNIRNSLWKNS